MGLTCTCTRVIRSVWGLSAQSGTSVEWRRGGVRPEHWARPQNTHWDNCFLGISGGQGTSEASNKDPPPPNHSDPSEVSYESNRKEHWQSLFWVIGGMERTTSDSNQHVSFQRNFPHIAPSGCFLFIYFLLAVKCGLRLPACLCMTRPLCIAPTSLLLWESVEGKAITAAEL